MSLVDAGRSGNVVVLCGETDETRDGGATGDGFRSERRLPDGSSGESGSRGLCRILNASCLEVATAPPSPCPLEISNAEYLVLKVMAEDCQPDYFDLKTADDNPKQETLCLRD